MRSFIDKQLKAITVDSSQIKIKEEINKVPQYEPRETCNLNHKSSKNIQLLVDCEDRRKVHNSVMKDSNSPFVNIDESSENQRKHKHCLRDNFLPSIVEDNLENEFHTKIVSLSSLINNGNNKNKRIGKKTDDIKIKELRAEKLRSRSNNDVVGLVDKNAKSNRNASCVESRCRYNRLDIKQIIPQN